jgi:hypothetical protein
VLNEQAVGPSWFKVFPMAIEFSHSESIQQILIEVGPLTFRIA